VSEFVEECRREWRRLGVPDPIANEMAADLTADIDEAEAEGGSAEDVLGNSVFDPRRFAASWAGARGVTAPVLAPLPAAPDRSPLRRSVPAIALAAVAVIFALVAIALLIGRRRASAAVSVRGILEGPGPAHLFGPGPVGPAFRTFRVGPFFGGPNGWPFALLAVLIFFAALVALGLAALYWSRWSPWSRSAPHSQGTARESGRTWFSRGSSR
jgi:hypothetical protein